MNAGSSPGQSAAAKFDKRPRPCVWDRAGRNSTPDVHQLFASFDRAMHGAIFPIFCSGSSSSSSIAYSYRES